MDKKSLSLSGSGSTDLSFLHNFSNPAKSDSLFIMSDSSTRFLKGENVQPGIYHLKDNFSDYEKTEEISRTFSKGVENVGGSTFTARRKSSLFGRLVSFLARKFRWVFAEELDEVAERADAVLEEKETMIHNTLKNKEEKAKEARTKNGQLVQNAIHSTNKRVKRLQKDLIEQLLQAREESVSAARDIVKNGMTRAKKLGEQRKKLDEGIVVGMDKLCEAIKATDLEIWGINNDFKNLKEDIIAAVIAKMMIINKNHWKNYHKKQVDKIAQCKKLLKEGAVENFKLKEELESLKKKYEDLNKNFVKAAALAVNLSSQLQDIQQKVRNSDRERREQHSQVEASKSAGEEQHDKENDFEEDECCEEAVKELSNMIRMDTEAKKHKEISNLRWALLISGKRR